MLNMLPEFNTLPHESFRTQQVGTKQDISFSQNGGVLKELLEEGVGEERPSFNEYIEVTYIAYVGEVAPEYIFDSSERDGELFTFVLGRGYVIKGFETAVLSMKLKERAIFYIRPEYAYGRGGSPPKIPANTLVVFDVQLVGFKEEDMTLKKDGSIVKKVLERGAGYNSPNDGGMVSLHIRGQFDDTVFMDKDVVFPFGEGSSTEYGIPLFVEKVLQGVKKNETARIRFKSERAFGSKGCDKYDVPVPPNKDVIFIISMKDYERVKDLWEMNNEERLDQCAIFKEKGTHYLKRNELGLALKYYKKMIEDIENDECMEGEEEARRQTLLVAGNLNMALVCEKIKDNKSVVKCCSTVLKVDPDNVKAYFRRGKAHYQTKDFQDARSDFSKVVEIEPNNKSARNFIAQCDKAIQASGNQERQLFQSMMSGLGRNAAESDPRVPGSGMNNISDWDNSMADGMMTLEQERAAFGEDIPTKTGNNHGIGH